MEITAKNTQPAVWLKGEKVYTLQISRRLRARGGFYLQRFEILPGLEVNWEQGFFTVWSTWILWWIALEYEFNPAYDKSEEEDEGMSTKEQIEYNEKHWMEHQRREDLTTERDFWQNVFLSKLDEMSVGRATLFADQALAEYKSRFS